ncbi:hypothetical protein HDU83_003133 [Entophlyctis luteolus]|nr:hypothetical protein HDU82_008884 [Entophlyctis luteolus]KAJ3346400.1 hypothetical protein HDU83_003133 [Entophlyctis luteolus]KAJ3388771.1 hypothetical protein HDU84_009467 [Entophlyctis sp. JEL0112]
MSSIRCVPLGAGQDVGRSCLILSIGGRNVMLDCGMHMGYNDLRRFPDFSYLSRSGAFNSGVLDAVIISHFHLDHCGALPYFTEICGYDGPVYMTAPTRAIAPILLEDMRKVVTERKGETNFVTSAEIRNCMRKVISVGLHETVWVDDELEIKAYYAGHVLGAAMFHIKVGDSSVVYTGDYNMTPDRHLGAAWIDECKPDLLITETTYATTTRPSKRSRELEFVQQVQDCVLKGGKVLIPVFALGRAQELCILIDQYWSQTGLTVPIHFSAGLTEKANHYYKLFIGWTNEKIKTSFSSGTASHNMFDFKNIKPFDAALINEPGPQVLFASPGMLHTGLSLDVFTKWCSNPKNMIILPGYCVPGTVGAKVLAGEKVIDIDVTTRINVNLQVKNLSFSAHTDAKGILQLIGMCKPRNVMLVHGEAQKMALLKARIYQETGIPCYDPPNGTSISISTQEYVQSVISEDSVLRAADNVVPRNSTQIEPATKKPRLADARPKAPVQFIGVAIVSPDARFPRVLDQLEAREELGLEPVELRMRICKPFSIFEIEARNRQMFWQKKWKYANGLDLVMQLLEIALRSYFVGPQAEGKSITRASERMLLIGGVAVIVSNCEKEGEDDFAVVEWPSGDENVIQFVTKVVAVVGGVLQ